MSALRHAPVLLLLPLIAALAHAPRAQCALQQVEGPAPNAFQGLATVGTSLALDGGRLALSSRGELTQDPGVDARGAVYVRTLQGDAWVLEQRLVLDGTDALDNFGFDVALDGDVLAVSLPGACFLDSAPGGVCDPGSVAIWERDAGAWQLAQVLQAPDGVKDDHFGASVDLDGERLAIGGRGPLLSAWIFERVDGTWTLAQAVQPSSPEDALFGMDVALDGDLLAVSAPAGSVPGSDEGAVYVFERIGGTWAEQARLPALHEHGNLESFRPSLDVSEGRVAVGSPRADQFDDFMVPFDDAIQNGAVLIIEEVDGRWEQVDTLRAGDAHVSAFFGAGVALDGDRALVGATHAPGASGAKGLFDGAGAAYLFERTPLGWAQIAKPFATGESEQVGSLFGYAVALDGPRALVGAPGFGSPVDPELEGRAFVAALDPLPCAGQTLGAAPELLSMADGASQVFAVQAGAAHAGELYAVLGSTTGTAPGVPLAGGALTLPLVPDAWFAFTLNNLGSPPYVAALGELDADGRAFARFDLPAGVLGDPDLVGFTLFHAALVRDPDAAAFTLATNPVQARLIF